MHLLLGSPTRQHVAALFTKEGFAVFETWRVEEGDSDIVEQTQTLLYEAGVSFQDLEGIVALTGPGSFSFSRTGTVAANAFRFSHDLSLLGLNMLQLGVLYVRAQGEDSARSVLSLQSTIHHSWFVGTGTVGSAGVPELETARVSQEELVGMVGDGVVVGDGIGELDADVYEFRWFDEVQLSTILSLLLSLPFSQNDVDPFYLLEPNIGGR